MNQIKTAVRVVTIKEGKVLLINNMAGDFYYLIGGKLEYGESLEEAARRELNEESAMEIKFKMIKPLYIHEFIKPEKNRHKFEIFIHGEIDKYHELEGVQDPDHGGTDELTWKPIEDLPETLLPEFVRKRLPEDYAKNFENISVPHYAGG